MVKASGRKKPTGDPAQKRERNKHHDGGGRRAHQGPKHFRRVGENPVAGFSVCLALGQPTRDVLHHDHGVIHHQPDGRGHPTQGHDVEALAEDVQQQARCRQHHGQHHAHDQGDATIPQKRPQDDGRQDGANDDGVPHAAGGCNDEFGLVVVRRDPDVSRKTRLLRQQSGPDGLYQRDGAGAPLLLDVEQYGILAVRIDARPLGHLSQAHLTHVFQLHQSLKTTLEHRLADVLLVAESRIGKSKVKAIAVFQATHGGHDVAGRQGIGNVRRGESMGL